MSKAIAEDMIYGYKHKLPIAIARPSIIVSAIAEPEIGFTQGLQVSQFLAKDQMKFD